MTNLTFERAVDIVVNTLTVKEPARQFHSPGGATVGASSSENVNRVRYAPKQSEGTYLRQVSIFGKQSQDNNGVVAVNMPHRLASSNSKDVSDVARQDILRSPMSVKGKSRVRSVTEDTLCLVCSGLNISS